MPLPPFKTEELFAFLTDILQTPSPTGYTHLAIERVRAELAALPGLEMRLTRKGSLLVTLAGEESQAPRALTAHVDTLGAMVKEVKANGRLELTNLGGLTWNGVEAEDCTVFTQSGGQIPGSLVPVKASAHVYGKEVTETERSSHNMEMRLDVRTESRQETQDLGIRVGDFVAFDPRVVQRNGYIRARFLDDKSCVACLVTAVKAIRAAGLNPRQTTYLLFSNFEEVGHGGAAGLPADTTELVVVDMAAVGEGQNSDEYHATICLKDSSGPYHHELSNRLRQLAKAHQIDIRPDIYPHYASDGSAALRAGYDVAVALIGPGVDASHHYERTHADALVDTTRWILAYLLSE